MTRKYMYAVLLISFEGLHCKFLNAVVSTQSAVCFTFLLDKMLSLISFRFANIIHGRAHVPDIPLEIS